MQYTAELHNWESEPTSSGLRIIGNIVGDTKERFSNMQVVRTSNVIGFGNDEKGNLFVRTRNSIYKLVGEEVNDKSIC